MSITVRIIAQQPTSGKQDDCGKFSAASTHNGINCKALNRRVGSLAASAVLAKVDDYVIILLIISTVAIFAPFERSMINLKK